MKLSPDWKRIVTRAWSVRWIALAGLLSGVEILVTAFPDVLGLPRGVLAGVTGVVVAVALIARVMVQKDGP